MSPRPRDSALGRIRLRHLQCFLAVAQFGNLRRAADALSITQPAVTKTLNELDELLGKALFTRGRHGALLTPEGEAFMRHANDSVAAVGAAVDAVRRERDAAPLRIGALPTVAAAFLPEVVRALVEHWPQVAVRVVTDRNTALIERLRERELDAVIGRLADPERMAGLSFELLYAEPMVIALRPGHALAPRRARAAPPALAAIGAHPLVLPPAGTLIRQVADGFLRRHGITPRAGIVETMDAALARALVLRCDNLWFSPRGAVQADLAAGTLARLGPELTPEEPVGLLLRTGPTSGTTLQAFVAAVRAHAGTLRSQARRKPAAAAAAKRARRA